MKRGVSTTSSCQQDAKRFCTKSGPQCSSTSPTAQQSRQRDSTPPAAPGMQLAGKAQTVHPAVAAVDVVLDRALCDADAALHLTLHAMTLAAQIYACGSAQAADRALVIAEQALAATVQQLARAQALVAHKAQAQAVLAAVNDAGDVELQDTCSSGYSCEAAGLVLLNQ